MKQKFAVMLPKGENDETPDYVAEIEIEGIPSNIEFLKQKLEEKGFTFR